jgi:hypothetical protein
VNTVQKVLNTNYSLFNRLRAVWNAKGAEYAFVLELNFALSKLILFLLQ